MGTPAVCLESSETTKPKGAHHGSGHPLTDTWPFLSAGFTGFGVMGSNKRSFRGASGNPSARESLGEGQADYESTETWTDFLTGLSQWRLTEPQMGPSDAHGGEPS